MFGYVKIAKEELKIREYYHFRAYYCGLCQELKSKYGRLGTFMLNYDVAFLSIFLSSLTEQPEKFDFRRCYLHPFRKRALLVESKWQSYAADVNLLLAYHNLRDNWLDEGSKRALAGSVILKRKYKKAARLHPVLDQLITDKTRELAELEKTKNRQIDAAADTFACILESICPLNEFSPGTTKGVRWLFYNLGKWIYLIDAWDDLTEDLHTSQYNPFFQTFALEEDDEQSFQKRVRPQAEFLLNYTLSQIAQAYELLDIQNNRGILDNIIYLGMNKQTKQVLQQRSHENREKKLLRNTWCERECFQGRNP